MRSLLLCIALVAGCVQSDSELRDIPTAQLAAEIAVRFAAARLDRTPSPEPMPSEGCVDGCTCNGTGREKTGDGLDTVDCRCPDGCDCKAASKQETSAPVIETVDEPPLVPVAPKQASGRVECRNGTCYWVEGGRRYRIIR